MSKWEIFTDSMGDYTDRLKIEGGFLYRTKNRYYGMSICFVPTIASLIKVDALSLKTAFDQGFEAGRKYRL